MFILQDIWKRWHLGHSLNQHGVQYRIARRGAELLKIGGRLVYSTCSLNPVENEAVLHRLLKDSEGALELVDATSFVPGLKYSPGISYWELSDKECKVFYKDFDEVPSEYHTIIRPQMFPPSKEDAPKYGLDKCLRILPHFQNTGGFFVAALTKTRNLPWEKTQKEPTTAVENDENNQIPTDQQGNVEEKRVPWGPQRKKRRIYGYKEDPFVFFTEEEPIWQEMKNFFSIDVKKLDTFKPTQLLTRTVTGKKKNIYFCSDAVKKLVLANEDNIKIINTGVKVFARCDHRNMQCGFRIANEGLDAIGQVIGESRRIEVTKNDMIYLLENTSPVNPPDVATMSEAVQERMKVLESGSCLLVYKHDEGFTITVVGWKGAKSIRAYIELNDSIHILRLLGADVTKFEKNKFQKQTEEATAKDGEDNGLVEGNDEDEVAVEEVEEDEDTSMISQEN